MFPYQDVEPLLPSELDTSQPCAVHEKDEETLESYQNIEGQLEGKAHIVHGKGLGRRYCQCPAEPKEESETQKQDGLILCT